MSQILIIFKRIRSVNKRLVRTLNLEFIRKCEIVVKLLSAIENNENMQY